KHLTLLQRHGHIATWSSASVRAGASHREEIKRQMKAAQVIVLLVSADFLASDAIYDEELDLALSRHANRARLLGVLLRPTDWKHGKFRDLDLEMHPTRRGNVVPVTEWQNRDAAFAAVEEAIRATLEDGGYTSTPPTGPGARSPVSRISRN